MKVELDLARERELWLEMGKQVERITETEEKKITERQIDAMNTYWKF